MEQFRRKEHYGFTYPADFDAMFRRKALFIKDGDAYDTEQRWTNPDIAGANEASAKIKIYTFTDLEGVKRDHDYRSELAKHFPQSHEELTGAGHEWHAVPLNIIPKEFLDNFLEYKDTDFNLATRPIIDWLAEKHAQIFAKFSSDNIKRAVKLRELQQKVIKRIIKVLRKKGINSSIIAELAPRFGKTICFLSLFLEVNKEFGHKVMLVPAYWLPAIVSYRKEVSKYRDYQNMVFVDTVVDTDWEEKVKSAISTNQLAVIGVSLYGKYEDFVAKHKWINEYTDPILAVPEEADFGAHCERQLEKLEFLFANKKVTKIVTSGTNIERMSKGVDANVADIVSVPYSLLEQSGDKSIVKRHMYQMFVNERLQQLVKEYSDEDCVAWRKLLEKAYANQDFVVTFFKAIYGYLPEYGLTLDGAAEEEIIVSMIFANITNDAIGKLIKLLGNHLPDHHIVAINGAETNGREAEDMAKAALRDVKNGYINKSKVIFIASNMGSRSFSVGDIQTCVFLTDGGSIDTFTQKNSRCITPLNPDEILLVKEKTKGHIFSFSFDANRERLDQLQILYEAKRVVDFFAEEGITLNIMQGVQYVLNSMNLKEVGFGDSSCIVNVTAEMLLKEYEDTEKALRVAGIATNYDAIKANPKLLELALQCAKMKPAQQKKVAEILKKGKTFGGQSGPAGVMTPDEERNIMKELIGAINSIIYSSTTVFAYTNFKGKDFTDCLNIISENKELDNNFKLLYNVSSNEVKEFLPYLPVELLDISVYNSIESRK